ncbi:hypothetical protein SMC26_19160 [Actinomadura fulvescens]|uniref:Uncharacterized protein n=1 Tax=Actinomadura fulvescens TaxID=46160 RepID=A0ABP6CQA0_9ACTN
MPAPAVALATAAVTVTLVLTPAIPVWADPGRLSPRSTDVVLDDPAPVNRPTLVKIKNDAQAKGISLQQALDIHIAQAANRLTKADEPDGPVDIPNVTIDDLTAAQLHDLALIAKDDGTDLATAIDAHGWQDQFNDIADKLEDDYPDQFSGAIKADDGSSAWFGFKGAIPPAAIETVKALPVKVTLTGNRGFSEKELDAQNRAAHAHVVQNSAVAAASAGYDIRTGTVTVSAQLKPEVKRNATLEAELDPPTPSVNGISAKTVVANASKAPMDGYLRGGGWLERRTASDNYAAHCTAAFNVIERGGSAKRSSTAGHCMWAHELLRHRNHGNDTGHTQVVRKMKHMGEHGDIAFNNTGTAGSDTPTRTFYFTHTKKRYADKENRPRVGTRVCKYGRTTGESCDNVEQLGWINDYGQWGYPVVYGLAETKKGYTQGGDSGGPWYYGGTVYGVTSGGDRSGDIFTPTDTTFYKHGYVVWTR